MKDLRPLEKKCSKCGCIKTQENFQTVRDTKKQNLRLYGHCKQCCNSTRSEKRKLLRAQDQKDIHLTHNKRTIKSVRNSFANRAKKQGVVIDTGSLTVEWYTEKVEHQGGVCAICKTPITDVGRKLVIDHCHSTGKIRGLLCGQCNMGLGAFKDNIQNLKQAIGYLEEYT